MVLQEVSEILRAKVKVAQADLSFIFIDINQPLLLWHCC